MTRRRAQSGPKYRLAAAGPENRPAGAGDGSWIVQVSAGMGPVEVRAFVGRLGAWLEDECAARGLQVMDVVVMGPAAAPSSVSIHVAGPAQAVLGDLTGTHVLVARSAHRGRRARKRWFAGVSVHARLGVDRGAAKAQAPVIDSADVDITAARAGGPGGQHVNRRASAVRAVHRPTGISVRVTEERSQHANRKRALARLAEILAAREHVATHRGRAVRRNAHYDFVRGNPVKSWRLDAGQTLIQDEE